MPSIASRADSPASIQPGRQVWVDQLRSFMIVLVVNMHACCTYSHVGGWYMTEGPDPGLAAKVPFFFWQGHMQAFFMGLLFFIAGHFASRSLERKGNGAFMWERFVRLVVPSFLYMLVIHPFIVVGLNPYGIPKDRIGHWLAEYYGQFRFIGQSGPLWFALALFIFCAVLVLWRRLKPSSAATVPPYQPTGKAIALLGAAMVIGTFLIRLVQPIGTNILNFQLCFFAQYILVFAVGVLSARQKWLESFARSTLAARLGWLGLIGGPVVLGLSLWAFPPTGNPPALFGGWSLDAFAMAFWEQLTGLALGIGCLALFSRHFNSDTAFTRWLSANSFCVYVIHSAVLVGLTLAFASIKAGPWSKMLLLTAVGLVVSFVLSTLLRLVPGVKRVL